MSLKKFVYVTLTWDFDPNTKLKPHKRLGSVTVAVDKAASQCRAT